MLLSNVLVCVIYFYFQRITNILGPDIHLKNIGKTHLVQFDSEGVFGWIPTQKDVINQFLSGPFVFCIYHQLTVNILALIG